MKNSDIYTVPLACVFLAVILIGVSLTDKVRQWPEFQTAVASSEEEWESYPPRMEGPSLWDFGRAAITKTTCEGLSTVLEVQQKEALIPRHDMIMGMTKLVMYTRDDKKVLFTKVLYNVWECLGFNKASRKYLIIAKGEHGVKITLRGLLYLDETQVALQDSVFVKKRFEATASLYSPDGNYLALIGAPEEEDKYGLYVLNTISDQLKKIGQPPAPPPLSAEQLEDPDAKEMMGSWEAPERHYTDSGMWIWEFTGPHTLRVSYGKDSLKQRSKNRKTKQWDLRKVFQDTSKNIDKTRE